MNTRILYYALESLTAFAFGMIATVYVVFYSVSAGLDPFQIVLVATVFEATIFLFEVPTGVLADTYSRRLSILIGLFLIGSAFLIEGLFPTLGVILVMEVIAGIGVTFTSGATEAWITDELGQVGSVFMRAGQLKTAAGMVGIITSVILASIQLFLPFVIAGVLLIGLALVLVFVMPERNFRRADSQGRHPLDTLRAIKRLRPALLVVLAVQFVFAFHSEGYDQLWQQHFLLDFTLPVIGALKPVVWFGVFSFGANLLSLGLNEVVRRRMSQAVSVVPLLMLLYGVMSVGIVAFALAQHFVAAVLLFWLVSGLRAVVEPLSKTWLNSHLDSDSRATMFSVASQIGSMGEIVGGLPVGAVASLVSVRAALVTAGVILSLTVPLLSRGEREVVNQVGD